MVKVKSERLGLLMIGSSLVVISVIIGLIFHYQKNVRRSQIREQGLGLARLLSSLPYDQLVTPGTNRGLLQVLQHKQTHSDFAYSAIVDTDGVPIAEGVSPGTIVPAVTFVGKPSTQLSEQILESSGDGRKVRDFCAPLVAAGEVVGYVRIGYFEPGYAVGMEQVPFFASLALPIFLLAPLFYLLVRREIRPLSEVNRQIQTQLETGQFQSVEINASGELHEFIERFNSFARRAEDHIHELELKERRMLTSAKVLSYQKAKTDSALEAIPDAAIVLDETGAVSFANSKVQIFLGVDPNEIEGKKPHEWCEDEDLLAFLGRYNGNSTPRRNTEPVEFSSANAPDKKLAASGYPLFSPRDASAVFGTLVVCRDVTAEAMAKQARSEFVAHVAHELKSPLNVLAMYGETLAGGGNDEQARVEAINVINDEVERLATLVNNLLNITKIEMGSVSLDRQRVKLPDLLRDVFESVGRSGKAAGMQLALDIPPEMSPVSLDKGLFRIAVNNLLTNAIKYNRPNGQVVLHGEETRGEIKISVRDNGLGIAPADLARIFDKFYRSEDEQGREKSGHGLGLPLARDIVELHHGKIEVRSEPEKGSEFAIRLRKNVELVQEAI
jgi:PAS domain S-box-containing protein